MIKCLPLQPSLWASSGPPSRLSRRRAHWSMIVPQFCASSFHSRITSIGNSRDIQIWNHVEHTQQDRKKLYTVRSILGPLFMLPATSRLSDQLPSVVPPAHRPPRSSNSHPPHSQPLSPLCASPVSSNACTSWVVLVGGCVSLG